MPTEELRLRSLTGSEPVVYRWKDEEDIADQVLQTIRLAVSEVPEIKSVVETHVLKDYDKNSFESMKTLCTRYNKTIEPLVSLWKGTSKLEEMCTLPSTHLLRQTLRRCHKKCVNDEARFSTQEFDEANFELVDAIAKRINFNEDDVFTEIGCGFGQVIIQIAASGNLKMCYGIETQDLPTQFSERLIEEFHKWMSFYGKDFSEYSIQKEDVTSDVTKKIISESTVILLSRLKDANEESKRTLEFVFSNAKKGSRIVSFAVLPRDVVVLEETVDIQECFCQSTKSGQQQPVKYFVYKLKANSQVTYMSQSAKETKKKPRGRRSIEKEESTEATGRRLRNRETRSTAEVMKSDSKEEVEIQIQSIRKNSKDPATMPPELSSQAVTVTAPVPALVPAPINKAWIPALDTLLVSYRNQFIQFTEFMQTSDYRTQLRAAINSEKKRRNELQNKVTILTNVVENISGETQELIRKSQTEFGIQFESTEELLVKVTELVCHMTRLKRQETSLTEEINQLQRNDIIKNSFDQISEIKAVQDDVLLVNHGYFQKKLHECHEQHEALTTKVNSLESELEHLESGNDRYLAAPVEKKRSKSKTGSDDVGGPVEPEVESTTFSSTKGYFDFLCGNQSIRDVQKIFSSSVPTSFDKAEQNCFAKCAAPTKSSNSVNLDGEAAQQRRRRPGEDGVPEQRSKKGNGEKLDGTARRLSGSSSTDSAESVRHLRYDTTTVSNHRAAGRRQTLSAAAAGDARNTRGRSDLASDAGVGGPKPARAAAPRETSRIVAGEKTTTRETPSRGESRPSPFQSGSKSSNPSPFAPNPSSYALPGAISVGTDGGSLGMSPARLPPSDAAVVPSVRGKRGRTRGRQKRTSTSSPVLREDRSKEGVQAVERKRFKKPDSSAVEGIVGGRPYVAPPSGIAVGDLLSHPMLWNSGLLAGDLRLSDEHGYAKPNANPITQAGANRLEGAGNLEALLLAVSLHHLPPGHRNLVGGEQGIMPFANRLEPPSFESLMKNISLMNQAANASQSSSHFNLLNSLNNKGSSSSIGTSNVSTTTTNARDDARSSPAVVPLCGWPSASKKDVAEPRDDPTAVSSCESKESFGNEPGVGGGAAPPSGAATADDTYGKHFKKKFHSSRQKKGSGQTTSTADGSRASDNVGQPPAAVTGLSTAGLATSILKSLFTRREGDPTVWSGLPFLSVPPGVVQGPSYPTLSVGGEIFHIRRQQQQQPEARSSPKIMSKGGDLDSSASTGRTFSSSQQSTFLGSSGLLLQAADVKAAASTTTIRFPLTLLPSKLGVIAADDAATADRTAPRDDVTSPPRSSALPVASTVIDDNRSTAGNRPTTATSASKS